MRLKCKKQKFAREESEDDVKKLLDFFEKMQKINPEFFYDYDVDADNRVRNVFWANASCRGSYEDFGDCITFDTMYKTNKFHMPLGVFVGVNHHLQSTIFAIALVRDETIPSFEWVFKTFLRCMNNKPPICMLTGTKNKKHLHTYVLFCALIFLPSILHTRKQLNKKTLFVSSQTSVLR